MPYETPPGTCVDCVSSLSGLCQRHRVMAQGMQNMGSVPAPPPSPFSLQSQQAAVLKALLSDAPPDKTRLRVSWRSKSGELQVDYVRKTSKGHFAFGAGLTELLTSDPGIDVHAEWVW